MMTYLSAMTLTSTRSTYRVSPWVGKVVKPLGREARLCSIWVLDGGCTASLPATPERVCPRSTRGTELLVSHIAPDLGRD